MRYLQLIVLVICGVESYAFGSPEAAIEAFLDDNTVKEQISSIPKGYKIDDNIDTIVINSHNFYVKESSKVLVCARVVPVMQETIFHSWSIMAMVDFNDNVPTNVKLIDQDKLVDNQKVISRGCYW